MNIPARTPVTFSPQLRARLRAMGVSAPRHYLADVVRLHRQHAMADRPGVVPVTFACVALLDGTWADLMVTTRDTDALVMVVMLASEWGAISGRPYPDALPGAVTR
jgi:hypothetical protein